MTQRLTSSSLCRSVTYIFWSSDFTSYLEDFLMENCCTTGPINTVRFYMEPPWDGGTKVCSKEILVTWPRWLPHPFTGDSLSHSPGDQTKYFEISVVWDNQSVTSFTFFMYVEFQLARKQSRTVELQNVTNSPLFTHSKNVWSMPVLHAVSSSFCDTHLTN